MKVFAPNPYARNWPSVPFREPAPLPDVDWTSNSNQLEIGLPASTCNINGHDDLESSGAISANSDTQENRQGRRLAELKTTVFDTYAICAALLASFACSTTFISEAELLQEVPWRRYTVQVQQFLVRVCIIGGIHAMLVFMFCALYAKSALARASYGLEVYERFSKETGAVRQLAFWSMYYTAILYSVQIAMSCVYSLPAYTALFTSILMLVLISRVVWDAQSIIKIAGCVFMSEDQVRAHLEAHKAKT